MDFNEIPEGQISRHPWELSRTESILWELRKYLKALGPRKSCIDLGAGDQFFDDALLSAYPDFSLIAVDIGYDPEGLKRLPPRKNADRITSVRSLAEIEAQNVDFALMMDSLEYMEDEIACLRDLTAHIRPGGYLFLTLPACTVLQSEHDEFVNSLRRYDKRYIRKILRMVPELELQTEHYFYSTLFPVRFAQRFLPLKVSPEQQTINAWKYRQTHPVTVALKAILNADYRLNAFFGKAGMDLPGLSLMLVCRKTGSAGGSLP